MHKGWTEPPYCLTGQKHYIFGLYLNHSLVKKTLMCLYAVGNGQIFSPSVLVSVLLFTEVCFPSKML